MGWGLACLIGAGLRFRQNLEAVLTENIKRLALHDLHVALGGKMVPFAGYEMPVQYSAGVMKEHLHCRTAAGLFDVSHMGQVILQPKSGYAATALAFEALMPVDVLGLAEGRQRYGIFTNETGGILDDLMFANRGDHLFVVVNAACKADDIAHMTAHLSGVCEVIPITDRGLLALQGPKAEAVLARMLPDVAAMRFMDVAVLAWRGGDLWISRSGYTGEDGFEIAVPEALLEAFAQSLLDEPEVMPIGLGARDSLRLEAGLCLYGNDMDETTTPVDASLLWPTPKALRETGTFNGADAFRAALAKGASRKRVGLKPEGRMPVRNGAVLTDADGKEVGIINSGGFGPTVNHPVAMGYVAKSALDAGSPLFADVRGNKIPVAVASLPFTPHRYVKG